MTGFALMCIKFAGLTAEVNEKLDWRTVGGAI